MSVNRTYTPARLSVIVGTAFGVSTLAVIALSGVPLALPLGIINAGVVGLGIYRRSRTLITVGGLGMLTGIVLMGVLGTEPVAVLSGTIAVALMWDASQNALTVGRRLGKEAKTRRVEVVHIAATGVLTALVAGCGYIVALVPSGTNSPVALMVLLIAVIVLMVALRDRASM